MHGAALRAVHAAALRAVHAAALRAVHAAALRTVHTVLAALSASLSLCPLQQNTTLEYAVLF